MTGIAELIRDLRRRKVFRGMGFYIVGAWSIVQIADVLGDPLGLPPWTIDGLLFLAVAGFPLAIWIAWRYELSHGRLVRTVPASDDEAGDVDLRLGAIDYVVLVALVAGVGFIAWRGLESIRASSDAEQAIVAAGTARPPAVIDAEDNTIAVLPFADISPNADSAYLADGVADTVLYVLSRVPELQVTARTSSFAYRDRALTASEIAAALNVAHVLEGSVQRSGDELRVIARVVDARTNQEIWSSRYNRTVDELFAIQDEIAESVATAMKVNVVDQGNATIAVYQPTLEAYEQYILGKRAMEQETSDSATEAVAYMERAIERDPDYALAYIGLWRALQQRAFIQGERPSPEAWERNQALIDRALELEPTLAEAWVARGALLVQRKDFAAAEKATLRALELNENLAEAHSAHWNMLMFQGDREGQLAAIRRAVALDPESARYQQQLAASLWSLARAEEAMATLKENIRRHPENPTNYMTLGRWLTQYGSPGEGMRYFQALRERDPGNMPLWKVTCEQFLHFWDTLGAEQCYNGYLEANPEDLDARKWRIYASRMLADPEGAAREAVAIGEREVELMPNSWYPKVQLAGNLLMISDYDRVISLLSEPFPQLLSPEPEVNDLTQWPARLVAEALWKSDRRAEAEPLLDAVLAWIERSRKLQAGGWIAGIEDAQIFCIREEQERCLDAFGRVVAGGWLFYSFGVQHFSPFDSVRGTPRFESIIRELEANARKERDYWYAHRDEPIL